MTNKEKRSDLLTWVADVIADLDALEASPSERSQRLGLSHDELDDIVRSINRAVAIAKASQE